MAWKKVAMRSATSRKGKQTHKIDDFGFTIPAMPNLIYFGENSGMAAYQS